MAAESITIVKKNKSIVAIIGGGAQAKYACETFLLTDVDIAYVVDLNDTPTVTWPGSYGCRVIGQNEFRKLEENEPELSGYLVCVADPVEKKEQIEFLKSKNRKLVNAIHPQSIVSSTAILGEGIILNAGAVVQPFAMISDGVMIHANCVVEHDVVIEKYANIAPGVSLAGWVKIGVGATVFTGAKIVPGVVVGEGAIVAAGATVIEDVAPWSMVAGCPARHKNYLDQ